MYFAQTKAKTASEQEKNTTFAEIIFTYYLIAGQKKLAT